MALFPSKRPARKQGTRSGANGYNHISPSAQKSLYSLLGEKRLDYIQKHHPRTKLLHTLFGIILCFSIAVHIGFLAVMAIRFLSAPAKPPETPRIIMKFHREQKPKHVGTQLDRPDLARASLEKEMAELLRKGEDPLAEDISRAGAEMDDSRIGFHGELSRALSTPPGEMNPADFARKRSRQPRAADAEKKKPKPPAEKPVKDLKPEKTDMMGLAGPEKKPTKTEEENENPKPDPRKLSHQKLPKPKSYSFTDWCRKLAQPVQGLGGGGRPVVPNSGSPEFFGQPLGIKGKTVIFVVDRSASMILESSKGFHDLDGALVRGTKLDRAKVELKRAVAALSEDTKFNMIFFSQYNNKWHRTLQAATPVQKDAAFKFIDSIRTGGETDTSGGIIEALMSAANKHVVLLSDGWPNIYCGDSSPVDKSKKHLARIKDTNVAGVRIDTFGFGVDERGRRFLANVASQNGGIYVEIESMDEE